MLPCTKRHVICLALTFPAFVYLFLMFAAIGHVCFRTEPNQPRFRENYLKLSKFAQQNPSLRHDKGPVSDVKDLHQLQDNDGPNFPSSFHNPAFSMHQLPQGQHMPGQSRSALTHNCSSISQMKIRSKAGHGVSKQTFVADFRGTQVAIKMVTRHIHEVRACLEKLKRPKFALRAPLDYAQVEPVKSLYPKNAEQNSRRNVYEDLNVHHRRTVSKRGSSQESLLSLPSPKDLPVIAPNERQRCYTFPTARLMKEILLSMQLHHRNLVTLLGFCVRSEESDSTDISEHGVISVYELGTRFVLDNLQILPWQTRLRHAIEMADLLRYLENSPLGSLVVPDFKEGHLVMVSDSLKLIDLDDVNNLEPECDVREGKESTCPYKIRCERALCGGFNAKENLKNMNSLVFKRLLFPLTFPQSVVPEVGQLNADLDSLSLTADELKKKLEDIKAFLQREGAL